MTMTRRAVPGQGHSALDRRGRGGRASLEVDNGWIMHYFDEYPVDYASAVNYSLDIQR